MTDSKTRTTNQGLHRDIQDCDAETTLQPQTRFQDLTNEKSSCNLITKQYEGFLGGAGAVPPLANDGVELEARL
uniref:Uncharacterized protein n=1 Tax=Romanomermis culicivorax TaxID=13658 RepID=A0A915ICK9_ROMCU